MRLLRVQDDERRRVARDLHDSSGQTLTALKLSVELLQKRLPNNKVISGELTGIALLANEALQEIRTTSYLLHPPLLEEVGFTSAAQWYVEGFARRSGMKVRIEFARLAERLPNPIETALFLRRSGDENSKGCTILNRQQIRKRSNFPRQADVKELCGSGSKWSFAPLMAQSVVRLRHFFLDQ